MFNILVKILNLLAIGGVVPIEEIASETGASEVLVLDKLTNLTQRGYLRLLDIACQSGCSALIPLAMTSLNLKKKQFLLIIG